MKNEQESSTCYANDSKSIPTSAEGRGGWEGERKKREAGPKASDVHSFCLKVRVGRLFICKQASRPDRLLNANGGKAEIDQKSSLLPFGKQTSSHSYISFPFPLPLISLSYHSRLLSYLIHAFDSKATPFMKRWKKGMLHIKPVVVVLKKGLMQNIIK